MLHIYRQLTGLQAFRTFIITKYRQNADRFPFDDVEPLVPAWLYKLAAQVQRPEVGIAGARLMYPAGTWQHAGIAIGIGDGCGHPGRSMNATPYWNWTNLTRDVSAVTGAVGHVDYGLSLPPGQGRLPQQVWLAADPSGQHLLVSYGVDGGFVIGWIVVGLIGLPFLAPWS